MSRDGPWPAVDALLAFVLLPTATTRADWRELARLLDALALARWSCPAPGDADGDGDDSPRAADADLRALLGARFPELGYYRTVAPLRDDGTRDGKPWFLAEVERADTALAPALAHFQRQTKARHAFQVVVDLPFVAADPFARTDPCVVPAATLLSMLP